MSILRKPYEISLWKDEWDSTDSKFKETRVMTIGSSDMEYQGRAIEPNLVRKTNGEVSFSFKMYYQFVDTMTGEDIHNPFVDHITNESKIKLNYNGEWFDLLVKNIVEDSATKSYSYQLVDQHMVELSKNGFNVELDSKLMNNLGTAEELATKVLADTDWEVESEHIVATQDEALVMLTVSNTNGVQAYLIDDSNLSAQGAVIDSVASIPNGAPIYAFYSACSGDKPYRFQFIYKAPGDKEPPYEDLFETYSDRIIAETGCQYYIDGLSYGAESDGFVIPTGFTLVQNRENNSSIGNRTAISTLYRGRRYVYTQTSEYHAGLDMYLEKYTGFAHNREAYWSRESTENNWATYSTKGYSAAWRYFSDNHKPGQGEQYHIGDIVKMTHKEYAPFYAKVTEALFESSETWYFRATTVSVADEIEYYKYVKTNYVTPNLIQNVINNPDFKGTSGWEANKFVGEDFSGKAFFKPITSFSRDYPSEAWKTYTKFGLFNTWTIYDDATYEITADSRLTPGEYFYLTDCSIMGETEEPQIYPLFQALSSQGDGKWKAISLGSATSPALASEFICYSENGAAWHRTYDLTNSTTTEDSWTEYCRPGRKGGWFIGDDPNGTATKDRLKEGQYIYLANCTVGVDGKQIYPFFKVLQYIEGTSRWELESLGFSSSPVGIIYNLPPVSSPEFSAKIESISAIETIYPSTAPEKITINGDLTIEIGSEFTTAIDAMLNNSTNVIGNSNYKPYLLCSNLCPISAFDASAEEDVVRIRPAIINNGTDRTLAFQQGITQDEKFLFKIDASLVRKLTIVDKQGEVTTRYLTNWNGKPTIGVKVRVADLAYTSSINGFALDDYSANEAVDGVLFSGEIGRLNGSQSLELCALSSVSSAAMKESKYQVFLDFTGVPNSGINERRDSSQDGCYSDYYVLIRNIQFYKLYPKADGSGYYSPDDEIETENISYNIETLYFPAISSDTRKKEDISFISVDSIFAPILSDDASRKSCVNVKESNYFNIIQSIAETFECWPKFIVGHNDNGEITTKTVKFFNYVGQENHVGFKYGVNSKDIKRTIDSNQIVSKLIVKANSNEYAPNGFCSIARAPASVTKDNVIYDFGYYANKGLINASSLQRDLYQYESGWTLAKLNNKTGNEIGGLYITTLLDENNVDDYISSCSGYYPKMSCINARLAELSDLISQNSAPLNEAVAKYDAYNALYETAKAELKDAQERFYKLAGFAYNAIPENEHNKVLESNTLYPILQTIAELTVTETNSEAQYLKAEEDKEKYEAALRVLEIQEKNALLLKTTLNKLFYQRYSRFIQEGTWVDESYIDETLYYNDALSVSYNSSRPKVTYSMNVIALAGLPGYELFDFKIGDQTFVEDGEFFGYDDDGNPHQEKVTIAQTSENLDDPSKNTIQIRNYENQFEDLFQRITATVQSVQYTEGSYKKASALAEADAAHKFSFLTDALSSMDSAISSTNNTVEVDTAGGKGITITNKNDSTQALRLTSGAILLQGTDPDTGNKIWKTGLTAQGISASLVTAGIVNTGEIQIMNGDEPTFRWDTHGITAYDFDNSASDVLLAGINKNKGVRFDRFGLYGYKLPDGGELTGENWKPTGINSGNDSIEDHSTFYLTWEGLKVKNANGTTIRIGDNSRVDTNDTSLLRIVDAQGTTRMVVNQNGDISATRLDLTGSTVDGEDLASKSDVKSATEQLQGYIEGIQSDLQKQVDGTITSWFYEGEPTVSNEPAKDWKTDADKEKHVGDLYYDTKTQYCYRWSKDTATSPSYSWVQIQDEAITRALANAETAQATADNKMHVFISTEAYPTPQPPYQQGDMWVNATYTGKFNEDLARCQTSKDTGDFSIDDWVLATRYTDDSKFDNFFENTYSSFVTTIQDSVDAKAEFFYSPSDPSSGWNDTETRQTHIGDLWKCTTDIKDEEGTIIYANKTEWVWQKNGSTYGWQRLETDIPDEVFDAIDGKNTFYVSKPESYNATDLWILENDTVYSPYKTGTIMKAINSNETYDAADWEKKVSLASDAELQDFKAAYDAFETSVQQQIDNKAETWYQADDPSAAWTTSELKRQHEGDLWKYTGEKTTTRDRNSEWVWQRVVYKGTTEYDYDVWVYSGDFSKNSSWNTGYIYSATVNGAFGYYYYDGSTWVQAKTGTYTNWPSGAGPALVTAGKITTSQKCYIEGTKRLWSYSNGAWSAPEDVLFGKWQEMAVPDEVFDSIDGKSNIFVAWPDTGVQINEGDILIPSSKISESGKTYSAGKVYRYIKKNGASSSSWEPIDYADTDSVTDVDDKITSVTNQITNGEGIFQQGLAKEASEATINKFDLTASSLIVYGGTGTSKKIIFSAEGTKDSNGDVTGGAVSIAGWTVTNNQLSYTPDGKKIGETGSFGVYPQGISKDSLSADFKGKFDDNDKWVMTAGSTFGVTADGEVYATAGKIGNMTIEQVNSLAGAGYNLIRDSSLGIKNSTYWAKHATDYLIANQDKGYLELYRTITSSTNYHYRQQYKVNNEIRNPGLILTPGKVYTISAEVKKLSDYAVSTSSRIVYSPQSGSEYSLYFPGNLTTDTWKRISTQWTISSGESFGNPALDIELNSSSINGIAIRNIKLEEGPVMTNWTLAPEEMVTSAQLLVTKDQILSTVSSTYTPKDTHNALAADVTLVKQTADAVALTAGEAITQFSGSFSTMGSSKDTNYFTVNVTPTPVSKNYAEVFQDGNIIYVTYTGTSPLTRTSTTRLNIGSASDETSGYYGYEIKINGNSISPTNKLEWKKNEAKIFQFYKTADGTNGGINVGYWDTAIRPNGATSSLVVNTQGITGDSLTREGDGYKMSLTPSGGFQVFSRATTSSDWSNVMTVNNTGLTIQGNATFTGTVNADGGSLQNLTLSGKLSSTYLTLDPSPSTGGWFLDAGKSMTINDYISIVVSLKYETAGTGINQRYTATYEAPDGWLCQRGTFLGWDSQISNNAEAITFSRLTSEPTQVTADGIIRPTIYLKPKGARGSSLRINNLGSIMIPIWDTNLNEFRDVDLAVFLQQLSRKG